MVFTETTGQQKQYFTPLVYHSTLVKISEHDFLTQNFASVQRFSSKGDSSF